MINRTIVGQADRIVMACVFPRSHGGDAGGLHPDGPTGPYPGPLLKVKLGPAIETEDPLAQKEARGSRLDHFTKIWFGPIVYEDNADQLESGVIPYKTDQEILDEVAGGPQSNFPDFISREAMDRNIEAKDQEAEFVKEKPTAERSNGLILAALKADAAYQNRCRRWIGGEDNDVGVIIGDGHQQSGVTIREDEEG
ncbi:hypothetical protein Tco_0504839 [Tanacetum coccineum]